MRTVCQLSRCQGGGPQVWARHTPQAPAHPGRCRRASASPINTETTSGGGPWGDQLQHRHLRLAHQPGMSPTVSFTRRAWQQKTRVGATLLQRRQEAAQTAGAHDGCGGQPAPTSREPPSSRGRTVGGVWALTRARAPRPKRITAVACICQTGGACAAAAPPLAIELRCRRRPWPQSMAQAPPDIGILPAWRSTALL